MLLANKLSPPSSAALYEEILRRGWRKEPTPLHLFSAPEDRYDLTDVRLIVIIVHIHTINVEIV